MPKDAVAWLAIIGDIFFMAFHISIRKFAQVSSHGFFFSHGTFHNRLDIGELFGLDLIIEFVVLK